MYKKGVWLLFLLLTVGITSVKSKQASLKLDTNKQNLVLVDSLDSAQVVTSVKDTITPKMLLVPDSLTKALIADSLSKGYGFPLFDPEGLAKRYLSKTGGISVYQEGSPMPKGEVWILAVIATLILLFAILKHTFSKQLVAIVQSFFSNRALGNLNKEDNLFTSWPFLLLFVQFGFTIGMFFYLMAQYKQIDDVAHGFQFYVTISILIIVLYIFKIIILRLLGYVFNVQKPVNEYVSILYLSYFNASLLFMPLVIAFALSPLKYGVFYIAVATILLAIIFVFQFIRAGINILSHYRFSKVYLFLYFCTLEICPILILIKAIGF
ncbi:DUF4271 domain-containing protein [Pedobacter sp. Hv1]|uniref:DUF4271 domain-containing protein n=1 Tax=Pedobacter sp. Hv1 TaxID=1740090 RepID=UPI0009E79BFB|nr:DUF4271 domain-containing protein [Pedobacter sp. Hv1]